MRSHRPRPVLFLAIGHLITASWIAPDIALAESSKTSTDSPTMSSPELSSQLAEVIVTATRREESSQNVGVALTAFSGNQLSELGIHNTLDLAQQVPALLFNNALGGDALAIPSIRGVSQNDFTVHNEGPVASYVDDVYLSFASAASFDMFDINRVEVLRGPQGTLFGRNATGGLIQYVSNRPTRAFEAYSDLTLGRFHEVRYEGAVSGPLTDSISGRLAAVTDYNSAYMKNLYGPDSLDEKSMALRMRLDVTLADNVDLLITLNYGKEFPIHSNRYKHQTVYPNAQGLGTVLPPTSNYYGTCPGCDPNGWRDAPTDAWTGTWDYDAHTDRQLYGATTDLEGSFGRWKWVWVNSYMNYTLNYSEDSDGTPFPVIVYHTTQSAYQISEEFRASADFDRVRLVSGLYLLDVDGNTATPTQLPEYAIDFDASWNQKTRTYAAFTQADWKLADRWTLTTGARFTRDQKIFDYVSAGNGGTGLAFNTGTVGGLADQRTNLWSGKLQLEWRPVDHTLFYAGVSRGVKGGGFNGSLDGTVPISKFPYLPETLISYESGFKTTLPGEALRINGSVFYYDYKNYQGFQVQNLTTFIGNYQGKANGGELEIAGTLRHSWDFTVGLSALHFVLNDVQLPTGALVTTHPPQAPSFQANLTLRKTWDLESGASLAAQVDAIRVSPYYSALTNSPDSAMPGYWLPNARLSYKISGRGLEISAFCKNFTNKQVEVYSVDVVSLAYNDTYWLPPRWYGINIVKHW